METSIKQSQLCDKILNTGFYTLSDQELISIVAEVSNLDYISKALNHTGIHSISSMARLSIKELSSNYGFTPLKAARFLASFHLNHRKTLEDNTRIKIMSSKDFFNFIHTFLNDLDHERFYVAFTNRSNHIIHHFCLSVGGTNGTVVDNSIITKNAILYNAKGVFISHNHPSGNLSPSDQDKTITTKIKNALKLFDITLLDHVIVANNTYYSFADEGILY